jgi:hypothetical protein
MSSDSALSSVVREVTYFTVATMGAAAMTGYIFGWVVGGNTAFSHFERLSVVRASLAAAEAFIAVMSLLLGLF